MDSEPRARLAVNFPQDRIDEVHLDPELVGMIRAFAQAAAKFFDEPVHTKIPDEEQVAVALERVFRLLFYGDDADSIRSATKSPWEPTGNRPGTG